MTKRDVPSLGSHLLTWAALLILLAASATVSRLRLGWWELVVTGTIAIAQALLVMIMFMRLKHGTPALRMIALLSFAWPLLMVTLTMGDYLTRSLLHSPF